MAEFDGVPRVTADITDGGLRIAPVPGTPKVTLIGITDSTAVTENEPVLVRPQTNLSDFDFEDGTVSPLSRAIIEARDAGAENIEVVVTKQTTSATAAQMKTYLDTTFALLVNHPLDIVVPVGVTIDMPSQTAGSNFAHQLAAFCQKATRHFNSCIGVIPTEPPIPYASSSISLAQLETWVAAMEDYDTSALQGADFGVYDGTTDGGGDGVPDNFAFWSTDDGVMPTGAPPANDGDVEEDRNGNPIDIGKYVSVVAGSYRFTNDVSARVETADGGFPSNGWYHSDGAAAYAGLIASLRPHHSPSNKVIPGVQIIRNLSIGQADRLSQKRFVVFQNKAKGVSVVDAMTGAYNISTTARSDFVRLSTMRITLEAIERIRSVADPFLGEPHNGISENALRTEIDQVLLKFQTEGALTRYGFELVSTPDMRVLGQARVNLTLVPAFEFRDININVGLQKE